MISSFRPAASTAILYRPMRPSLSLPSLSFALLAPLLASVAAPTHAAEFSASGFGTLGYARSDRAYAYQRFIDDHGTLQRDSVAGLQVDARFDHGFGATVQVKAAARADRDTGYEASIAWAFVSYRPSNDWLFRLGKQRIPLYLYSENYDVGATYDFARLPVEMYSISPSNDFVGASFGRTWKTASGEWSLDGYMGESKTHYRVWLREAAPGLTAGAQFGDLTIRGGGLLLTHRSEMHNLRIGLLRVRAAAERAFPATYPFVGLAPGLGYYQVDAALPGPGVPLNDHVDNTTLTLGAELSLPRDFRVVGEFARSIVPHDDLGPQGNRGYLAVLRKAGAWTPYASYAFLRSPKRQRDLHGRVNDNLLPDVIPGAALINPTQRAGADQLLVYHQHTFALGTSYTISPTSKLKAEIARTRIGDVSALVDARPATTVRNANINVLTLSYSVVF